MLRKGTLALGLVFSAIAACSEGSADGAGGSGGSGIDGGGSGGSQAGADQGGEGYGGSPPATTCQGWFRILQKDAYSETAGRSGSFWPPHTTTTFSYTCDWDEGDFHEAIMNNHGTLPSAIDQNGFDILEEVATVYLEGSPNQFEQLEAAYRACECDTATNFFSLDGLGDDAVQAVVSNLVEYFQANLECPAPGGVDQLITNLQAGDIDLVVEALPTCEFINGDLEQGLNGALSAFLATSGARLDDYHVCNNDARLQTKLMEHFGATYEVSTCDATSGACRAPIWFYDPEVR